MTRPDPLMCQVRVAWQTDRLDECRAFYASELGLEILGDFEDHDGYSGVLLGLPGSAVHLELTQRTTGSPATPSADDDLLVLYLEDAAALERMQRRLGDQRLGTTAANPYWQEQGATAVRDPDGRTLVLMPRPFD